MTAAWGSRGSATFLNKVAELGGVPKRRSRDAVSNLSGLVTRGRRADARGGPSLFHPSAPQRPFQLGTMRTPFALGNHQLAPSPSGSNPCVAALKWLVCCSEVQRLLRAGLPGHSKLWLENDRDGSGGGGGSCADHCWDAVSFGCTPSALPPCLLYSPSHRLVHLALRLTLRLCKSDWQVKWPGSLGSCAMPGETRPRRLCYSQ